MLTTAHFLLLGWSHPFYQLFLAGIPDSSIPTPQGLQVNPEFIFTASFKKLSGPPCWDIPDTYLAHAAFLSHGERFHISFLVFNSKTRATKQVILLPAPATQAPLSITFALVLCCCFFPLLSKLSFNFFSQAGNIAGWGLTLRLSLPVFFIHF